MRENTQAWECPDAVDERITSHLPLVGHLVRETLSRVPRHVERDDLMSAGATALVLASRSWDAERGVPFARYASTRIRGAILDELRGIDWASRSVRRRARDLTETRSRLAAVLGRIPTAVEVAESLGLGVDEVLANDEDVARANVVSLQGFGTTDMDDVLDSHVESPAVAQERGELMHYLVDAIAELPERMRAVVEDFFLLELPMAHTAQRLGVSESRISQIRAEALVLLRGALDHVGLGLQPEAANDESGEGCASRRRLAYYGAVADRHAAAVHHAVVAPVERLA